MVSLCVVNARDIIISFTVFFVVYFVTFLCWLVVLELNCCFSNDHLLLNQSYYRRKPKLTLFILDRSFCSKLCLLEVQ